MASFDSDQAEGLRRLLAGPKPHIVTFLSVMQDEEKSAMLVNLGASLTRAGSDVLLLDARSKSHGVSSRLPVSRGATLLEVARQERALDEVVRTTAQGFGVASMAHGAPLSNPRDVGQLRRLANAFNLLATQTDIVLVDGELDADDMLPVPAMAASDIVVQVSGSAASIKAGYSLIKRLNARLGRRPFSILITGTSEKEAQLVYANMAQAASRYLAVQLNSVGFVPADEHLKRAMKLGRPVVEAFPLAGASVAFRQLAGRLASSGSSATKSYGMTGARLGA